MTARYHHFMTAELLEVAPVSSVLADLRTVPLDKLPGRRDELNETLGRLLPKAEVPQVTVAAFNSSI